VGILLYRKHVITEQPYIAQLIETMEEYGLRPLPIFINGVEAHTVASAGGSSERSCRCFCSPV
jgi:magnesium chelatase subunit H